MAIPNYNTLFICRDCRSSGGEWQRGGATGMGVGPSAKCGGPGGSTGPCHDHCVEGLEKVCTHFYPPPAMVIP